MAISGSWYIVIRSHRQLNTGKFAALNELEQKLDYPFFRREWELLKQGKNRKVYWKLTVVETFFADYFLPTILLFLGDRSIHILQFLGHHAWVFTGQGRGG